MRGHSALDKSRRHVKVLGVRDDDEVPPFAEVSRRLLRSSLLDVARNVTVARGWSAMRMVDVARQVGVSRPTLYKQFPTKAALGLALVNREVDRFLAAVDAALDRYPEDPVSGIEAAAEAVLRDAADDVFAKAVLVGTGSSELLPLVTTEGGPVQSRAAARVLEYLARSRPQLQPERAALLADGVVRLALSYVVTPAAPAELAARGIASLISPFLFASPGPEEAA